MQYGRRSVGIVDVVPDNWLVEREFGDGRSCAPGSWLVGPTKGPNSRAVK